MLPATFVVIVHLVLLYIAIAQSKNMGAVHLDSRQIGAVVEANLYSALPQNGPSLAGKDQDRVTPHRPAGTREASSPAHASPPAEQSERPDTGADGSASQPSNNAANPARSETGADTSDVVATEFQHQLLTHIEPFLKYPEDAAHPEGIVVVLFSMTRDGAVLGAWIKQSSGSASLDREAITAVMKAQPLPSIPSQLPDPLNVELPVSFGQ